ncbi:hypothetical protein F5X98DRAFT_148535 [Xylaria grammica]|nr:hypothetical protein F5X98DRAFT_148535 [Xylaria grammica]
MMIITKPFSLLLSVALLVSGSGITLDDLDPLRDLSFKTHANIRDPDVHDETEDVDAQQSIEEGVVSTKYLPPLTTSTPISEVSGLAKPCSFEDAWNDIFQKHIKGDICGIASRFSAKVSSTVSSAILSSVQSQNASVFASMTAEFTISLAASLSAAHDSAQSAINAAKSNCYAAESTSLSVDNSNSPSDRLEVNADQLAGIIVGVFLTSSISSILATLFILRYRRQRAAITHMAVDSSAETKRQTRWPTFRKLRGDMLSSKQAATATTSHREPPEAFPPMLERDISPQTYQIHNPIDRVSFASPVSPSSTSDQIFSVSPLSDKPSNHSDRDRSPSWGLGLFRNNTQRTHGSKTSNVSPIKFSLARKITQNGPQRIQVVRVGEQATRPRRFLSNVRTAKTFLSNDGSTDRTVPHEEPGAQDSTDRIERGAVALAPMANISVLSPPLIPLRFSSLNMSKPPLTENSAGIHGDNGTFLLSTDDESANSGPGFSQDQSGLESSSHSSVILRDPTQFDPGGLAQQQPMSRFSMSSAPLSLEYSAPSTPPAPQYNQPREHSELFALRPAPPTPPQLQAPTPRRPSSASNVGIPGTIYI